MVDLGNLLVDGLDNDVERLYVSECNEVIHFKLGESFSDNLLTLATALRTD